MDFMFHVQDVGTTLKYLFPDETMAKAFVRTVTLQFEVPAMRNHHVVYVVVLEEQMHPILEMAHSFGGWPE